MKTMALPEEFEQTRCCHAVDRIVSGEQTPPALVAEIQVKVVQLSFRIRNEEGLSGGKQINAAGLQGAGFPGGTELCKAFLDDENPGEKGVGMMECSFSADCCSGFDNVAVYLAGDLIQNGTNFEILLLFRIEIMDRVDDRSGLVVLKVHLFSLFFPL